MLSFAEAKEMVTMTRTAVLPENVDAPAGAAPSGQETQHIPTSPTRPIKVRRNRP